MPLRRRSGASRVAAGLSEGANAAAELFKSLLSDKLTRRRLDESHNFDLLKQDIGDVDLQQRNLEEGVSTGKYTPEQAGQMFNTQNSRLPELSRRRLPDFTGVEPSNDAKMKPVVEKIAGMTSPEGMTEQDLSGLLQSLHLRPGFEETGGNVPPEFGSGSEGLTPPPQQGQAQAQLALKRRELEKASEEKGSLPVKTVVPGGVDGLAHFVTQYLGPKARMDMGQVQEDFTPEQTAAAEGAKMKATTQAAVDVNTNPKTQRDVARGAGMTAGAQAQAQSNVANDPANVAKEANRQAMVEKAKLGQVPQWIVRNGVVLHVAQGGIEPGDEPYKAPAAGSNALQASRATSAIAFVNRLKEAYDNMTVGNGPGQLIQGVINKAKGAANLDNPVTKYQKLKKATAIAMAVAIQGSRPSDKDAEAMADTLPDYGTPKEVSDSLFTDMLQQLGDTGQAMGGRAIKTGKDILTLDRNTLQPMRTH